MTFLDPLSPLPPLGTAGSHLARVRRLVIVADRRRSGDEDGARKALGNDPTMMPAAVIAGASLEYLARIALG